MCRAFLRLFLGFCFFWAHGSVLVLGMNVVDCHDFAVQLHLNFRVSRTNNVALYEITALILMLPSIGYLYPSLNKLRMIYADFRFSVPLYDQIDQE